MSHDLATVVSIQASGVALVAGVVDDTLVVEVAAAPVVVEALVTPETLRLYS